MKRSIHKALLAFAFLFALTVGAIPTVLTHLSIAHASVSGFVTRSGSHLMLNGSPFRFAGATDYELVLDERNNNGVPSSQESTCTTGNPCNYTTQYQMQDAFATAQEMGATVMRVYSILGSTGCSLCVEPTLGTFNETTLEHLDYAVMLAGQYHIRLLFGWVDNWHWYDGGVDDWANPGNSQPAGYGPTGPSDSGYSFYTDPTIMSKFENLISTILNRTNTYTGVQYKNDPTIFGWLLGAELDGEPHSWAVTISNYIKSIDPNHLISDGDCTGISYGCGLPSNYDYSAPNIDMYVDDEYPISVSQTNTDAAAVTSAGKVYYIGEFDWSNYTGQDGPLSSFLSNIQSNSEVAGDIYFDLYPHADQYGYITTPSTTQVGDGDGTQLYLDYPGETSTWQTDIQDLRTHAYAMQGYGSPPAHAPVAAPIITSVVGKQIAWQGVAGAASYSVERSTSGANGPWTVVCNQCATDFTTPWTDSSQPGGQMWYQVQGYNLDGVAGPFSPAFVYNTAENSSLTLVDNLENWNETYSHSSNLTFDASNPSYVGNDWSRADRTTATNEDIVWNETNITAFTATTYFWPGESVSPFSIYTSPDDASWTLTSPTINSTSGPWNVYVYRLSGLSNVNYIKVVWNNTSGQYWNPQLGQVSITYSPGGSGGTNLVQNPGFETGNLTDWNVWVPSGQSTTNAGVEQTPSHSGNYNMCEYNGTSAFQVSVYQTFSNIPNGTYTLSGWIEGSGNSVMQIRDAAGGNVLKQYAITNSIGNWQQVSVTATITGGQADIEFDTQGNASNYLRVDDVVFALQ